jgi:exodeoxyribonuclease VII small subunit
MPKASAATPSTGQSATPETYEAAMAELEQLASKLESGDLPLDQLLVGYQRGAFLLQFCRDQLKAVEDQIQVLENGSLSPWKAA